MRQYMSTAKILGRNPMEVKNNDLYGAVVTTEPGAGYLWQHGVWLNMHNTAFGTGVVIEWKVELTYYCEFYNRKAVAQS